MTALIVVLILIAVGGAIVWKPTRNWLRGMRDKTEKKLADPVRDGGFAIEDSRQMIVDFTRQVAGFSASIKVQHGKRSAAEKLVTKYSDLAERAAKDGNKEDLVIFVTEKQRAKEELATIVSEIKNNERALANVKAQLKTARDKVVAAESKYAQLQVRKQSADVRQGMADAGNQFSGDDNPLAALDNLDAQVAEAEALAEATEEMSGGVDADVRTAAAKYESGGQNDVQDEVQNMLAAAKAASETETG